MRLSIEITPKQHQYLKATAAMQGVSIKEYVLKRTLPDLTEDEALEKLEAFLNPRIKSAKADKVTSNSIDEIFADVLAKA